MGQTPTLDDIVGKTQEWAYLSAKLRTKQDSGAWEDVEGEAWQLVTLAGAVGEAGADDGIDDHILDLLDGKTEKDFYQLFYQDAKVRAHPELISAATERTLLTSLEAAGRITRDTEGIYHKAAADLPSGTQAE